MEKISNPKPPSQDVTSSAKQEPRLMHRTLPYALLRAREGTLAMFRPLLTKYGLIEQNWRVMRILHEFGELDIGELSQHTLILGPSLSRMIKTMQKRKLLVIRNGKQDKRRTLVRNSARAEELIHQITAETNPLYKEIERNFTSEDMDKLFHYLELLAASPNR